MDRMEANLREAKRPAFMFQSEVSIIIVGLPFVDGEIPLERGKSLLSEELRCDPVPEIINVERMSPRGRGPGVIKVEFRTQQEKVAVLHRKRSLRDNENLNRVFIHAAKSHAERLVNLNFRTLLTELPFGKEYFLTGSRRLVKRDQVEPAGSASRNTRSCGARRESAED
ncbi:hypothetical protein ABVT39_008682 [Epinephelus coioides]